MRFGVSALPASEASQATEEAEVVPATEEVEGAGEAEE